MPLFGSTDMVRDIVLVLDAGVVLYTFLFAGVFVAQWLKSPIRRWKDVTFVWALFMMGMALNSLFFIMSDFVFTQEPMMSIVTKAGYLSMMMALIAFFFAMEQILPYKTKHAFTTAGVILAAMTPLTPTAYLTLVALGGSLLTFIVLSAFLAYSVRSTTGVVRRSMQVIFVSFLIGFLGYIGRSDFVYYNLGSAVYVLAALFLVTGLLTMGITIVSSPALDELDWREQLLDLFVIHNSGLLLFHHVFEQSVKTNEDLAAAGIVGIQTMFKEILQSPEGFSSLSIGQYHVLFAQDERFSAVLIAKKPYNVLLDKVQDFSEKFGLVFDQQLKSEHVEALDEARILDLAKIVFE